MSEKSYVPGLKGELARKEKKKNRREKDIAKKKEKYIKIKMKMRNRKRDGKRLTRRIDGYKWKSRIGRFRFFLLSELSQ